jgi:hypothetical protein
MLFMTEVSYTNQRPPGTLFVSFLDRPFALPNGVGRRSSTGRRTTGSPRRRPLGGRPRRRPRPATMGYRAGHTSFTAWP